VDCTGHGVPGAFVSIVGGNILNQVVRQNDFTQADEILNSVNTMFNMSIRQTFEDSVVKDGMDLVLCVIDKENMNVNFAGAYNPLYIVRDNEINIYKGDKFPIGIFIGDEVKKFSSQNIPIQKNDVLYLFSDVYVDQFGGNENKKLMHKRFSDIILENSQLQMKLQHYNFELFFENWKGNREQVDDILLIGLRI
jgi:serine phosphatase RsbU (regulator of sigma subunit)